MSVRKLRVKSSTEFPISTSLKVRIFPLRFPFRSHPYRHPRPLGQGQVEKETQACPHCRLSRPLSQTHTHASIAPEIPNQGIETSALLDELNAAAVNNRRYNADRLCKVTLLCTPNTTRENLLSLIDHLQSTCPALTLHGLHFPNPTLTHPEDATLSNLHPFLLDANTTGDLRRDIANAANLPSPYQLEFSLQLQSVDDVQRLAHVITSGASALHLDFLLP